MNTRGVRLNNPGLLRHGPPWQGLAADQPDTEFSKFQTMFWGFRALAINLITYQDKHGLRTVEEMIQRWAPHKGQNSAGDDYTNNTNPYIMFVARQMGVSPHQAIDVHQHSILRPMVEAIAHFENAHFQFDAKDIDRGLLMAGVEPPPKPVRKSRTVQGGAVAGVATLMAAAQPAVPVAERLADSAPLLLGLIALAGIGYMLYARWDDRRRGYR